VWISEITTVKVQELGKKENTRIWMSDWVSEIGRNSGRNKKKR